MEKFGSIQAYERYIVTLRHQNRLSRYATTRLALDTYENFMRCGWRDKSLYGTLFAIDERKRLAQLVGRAYGFDTRDINDPVTCEATVRPGEWLRKIVGYEYDYPA